MSIKIGSLKSSRGKKVAGKWYILKDIQDDRFSLSVEIHTGNSGDLRLLIATGPHFQSSMTDLAIASISKKIDCKDLFGTIVILPDFISKLEMLQGTDKPFYPGWPHGDIGEKIAFEIFDVLLKQVDYALFLEGTDPDIKQIPHAAIYCLDDPLICSCHEELIKTLGHDLIIEKETTLGSFAVEAQRHLALPVLVSQTDDFTDSVETQKWIENRVFNFLAFMKLIDSQIEMPDRTFVAKIDNQIRSCSDGEMRFNSDLGHFISEGDLVGSVQGEKPKDRTKVEINCDGYIVRQRHSGKVVYDDFLCSVLGATLTGERFDQISCTTAIDNSNMDAEIRPNKLFKGLQ